jgi:hypothetical protein
MDLEEGKYCPLRHRCTPGLGCTLPVGCRDDQWNRENEHLPAFPCRPGHSTKKEDAQFIRSLFPSLWSVVTQELSFHGKWRMRGSNLGVSPHLGLVIAVRRSGNDIRPGGQQPWIPSPILLLSSLTLHHSLTSDSRFIHRLTVVFESIGDVLNNYVGCLKDHLPRFYPKGTCFD